MPHLKRVIAGLAELSYTMVVFNLEHRFTFPSCPGIAPPGSLTTAMARELVAYGRGQGVEVVPQPNLIGHCEGIGATERYAHLTTDPYMQQPWGGYEQLNLELPAARELVRCMLADVLAAFPGEYVDIGGDEVRRMDHIFPGDANRQLAAMKEHLAFVLDLARASGRKVMMWGDMPLHHAELMDALPRDVVICDWHYGSQGSRETLERYRDAGFKVLACPSAGAHGGFAGRAGIAHDNVAKMVGDAVELGLEGFLLTTWENGFGSSFDINWPGIALAAQMGQGCKAPDCDTFLATFAVSRYGVDGAAYARLHYLLGDGILAALAAGGQAPRALVTLRKMLFRATWPFADLARPRTLPDNRHLFLSEPSPFHAWLYLRPILTKEVMTRLLVLRDEASAVAERLRAAATARAEELEAMLLGARMLGVLVERVALLEEAKRAYHETALAQGDDTAAYATALATAAACLERLRPGIQTLREIVAFHDARTGFDREEARWLDVHEKSLNEHIAALARLKNENENENENDADSLLEFGEFLRRPAHIAARLTWR